MLNSILLMIFLTIALILLTWAEIDCIRYAGIREWLKGITSSIAQFLSAIYWILGIYLFWHYVAQRIVVSITLATG